MHLCESNKMKREMERKKNQQTNQKTKKIPNVAKTIYEWNEYAIKLMLYYNHRAFDIFK